MTRKSLTYHIDRVLIGTIPLANATEKSATIALGGRKFSDKHHGALQAGTGFKSCGNLLSTWTTIAPAFRPCQRRGNGFESRYSLQFLKA